MLVSINVAGGGTCDFNTAAPASIRIVRLVATANIALSGVISIDSSSTITGDRILAAAQTTASENGIYVANDAGAWARATDWNDSSHMQAGSTVYVTTGVTCKYSTWVLTNLGAIVVGSTSLVFKPNGQNFDPNPGLSIATGASIGVAELRLHNNGTTNTIASFRGFSEVGLLQPINSGVWLGGTAGYRGLTDTTGWVAFAGSQGKMTSAPLNLSVAGAFPGYWSPTPDLNNFKLYAFDGQTNGSWKCYGEAYTALKRGSDLTDANTTLQPFTDKASRYDLPIATLTANRTKTLGTTTVVTGAKVTIVRRDATANTLAIVNGGGGGGTLITFAASPTEVQRATFRFDGTNWALVDFEYVEA